MIIVENVIATKDLVKTYSDQGMLILQEDTGVMYPEAIDPVDHTHVYSETNIPISDEDEITDTEAYYILVGRELQ